MRGSSPHTRGLQGPGSVYDVNSRIIPAHAGFTRCPWSGPPGSPDHPRTRGVYEDSSYRGGVFEGSSPHTRGLLHDVTVRAAHVGIIPAHAGFTYCRRRNQRGILDHPRTRGVYVTRILRTMRVLGSSPHTRGLPRTTSATRCTRRIIPAHAGFTHAG